MIVKELLKKIVNGLDDNNSGSRVAFIYDEKENEIFDIKDVHFSSAGLEIEMEK